MAETIITIGAVVGALGTIAGAAIAIAKIYAKLIRKFDELSDAYKENELALLRLEFVSSEMPIGERLIAGDKYVSKGGNGEVKAQYHALCEEYEEIYREVVGKELRK